jgi:tRNA 2-thiouridine synthesizing protein A
MNEMADKELDCTGLFCPEPVFRTRMALDDLDPGQTLEVHADDPAAYEDLRRLAERLGHKVLSIKKEGEETIIVIKKKD